MSPEAGHIQSAEAANANFLDVKGIINEKQQVFKGQTDASDSDSLSDALVGPNGEQYPTSDELKTLRRTHGHVPWLLYTIAFVELCERFAYYGTTIVCTFDDRPHRERFMLIWNYSLELHQLAIAKRFPDGLSRY